MVCYSDAFDYEFGVGILRLPERMYHENEEIIQQIVEEDNLLHPEEENNYDGKGKTHDSITRNIHYRFGSVLIQPSFSVQVLHLSKKLKSKLNLARC